MYTIKKKFEIAASHSLQYGKDRSIFIIPVDADYQNIKIILMPIMAT